MNSKHEIFLLLVVSLASSCNDGVKSYSFTCTVQRTGAGVHAENFGLNTAGWFAQARNSSDLFGRTFREELV